jgi:hypothetical protein
MYAIAQDFQAEQARLNRRHNNLTLAVAVGALVVSLAATVTSVLKSREVLPIKVEVTMPIAPATHP